MFSQHKYNNLEIIYLQITKKTVKKKLISHSKVKQNQPDRCRLYKTDMDKLLASTA